MSVLVKVEAVAKPECVEEFIQSLEKGLPDTRASEGCRDITAYLHEDGVSFVVVEHWESKAHYEKYLAWRTQTGVMDALATFLVVPLEIKFFQAIEA